MNELLTDAASRAARYLDEIQTRRVSPEAKAIENIKKFNQPLQDQPIDPTKVLEELDTLGSPATMVSADGRFFGFVIGGSLPAALAANMLAGAWDQNAGGGSILPGRLDP